MLKQLLDGDKDEAIEELIKPPRVRFSGFDWNRADRLKPTGAAHTDKHVAARLTRERE